MFGNCCSLLKQESRGKSELRRTERRVTPGGKGNPITFAMDSATENRPSRALSG